MGVGGRSALREAEHAAEARSLGHDLKTRRREHFEGG
jgi:hypothetical protein